MTCRVFDLPFILFLAFDCLSHRLSARALTSSTQVERARALEHLSNRKLGWFTCCPEHRLGAFESKTVILVPSILQGAVAKFMDKLFLQTPPLQWRTCRVVESRP